MLHQRTMKRRGGWGVFAEYQGPSLIFRQSPKFEGVPGLGEASPTLGAFSIQACLFDLQDFNFTRLASLKILTSDQEPAQWDANTARYP